MSRHFWSRLDKCCQQLNTVTMDLTTPVSALTRVGAATAARLKHLGVITAKDLLYYFPFRYEDFRTVTPIDRLQSGMNTTVSGTLELIANRRTHRRGKIITEGLVSDKTGSVRVVWFNQPFLTKTLHVGDALSLSGTVKDDMLGVSFVSPTFEKIAAGGETTNTGRLVPVYPLTANVTEKQIRFLIKQALPAAKDIPEWLPESVLEMYDLAPLAEAIRGIHFPADEIDLAKSTERLKFDELFLLQLQAELNRRDRLGTEAPPLYFKEKEIKEFVKNLPFTLTKTQKIAAWEIVQNIAATVPMNRLLSGDVGSGKTVVAAIALYSAVLNGYQGIIMAPTEILAAQHFASLIKLFQGLPVSVGLLTANQATTVIPSEAHADEPACAGRGSLAQPTTDRPALPAGRDSSSPAKGSLGMTADKVRSPKKQKEVIIAGMNDGTIQIIVGTHALLSEGVNFKKLGLVIVDEQHRFGVEQRKKMKEKQLVTPPARGGVGGGGSADDGNHSVSPLGKGRTGLAAHFLSMTATPIPRSLALMLYGDLDVSIINELPPGRKKIITRLVEPAKREKAYGFIRDQVKNGRQVFVVCPLIEEIKEQRTKNKEQSNVVIPTESRRDEWRNPLTRESQRSSDSSISLRFTRNDSVAGKKSVLSEYEKLSKHIFPDLQVGYLHGKMKPKEKDEIMDKFKKGEIDILVSTSVVEVGVDIPNASVMMIEGADRFGLAQLHQFRGRVGRSSHQSYCLLFTDSYSPRVNERLKYFEAHHDGFTLAEKDLEMRGPGEVYGVEQSGMQQLRLATLMDREIIKKARSAVQTIIPDISKYPKLLDKITEWGTVVHLE